MAVIKVVSSRASIATALRYVTKTEKTEQKLISGLGCSPDTVIDEMKITKQLWNKMGGRQYKHYVQSFPPDENITPEQAHEIAAVLCAERFKGFEVLVATHKDRDHIHSHFIVNSVNYESGKKFQESVEDLQALKDLSDELCRERGFSICVKGDEVTAYNKNKYSTLEKAITGNYKSYLLDCYYAVKEASGKAESREEFIRIMLEAGYDVNWSDNRKYITFTDSEGHKIRNSNLEKTFKEPFGKEDLEYAFKRKTERAINKTGGGQYAKSYDTAAANGFIARGNAALLAANDVSTGARPTRYGEQVSSDFIIRDHEPNLRNIEQFYDRYAKRAEADERAAIESAERAKSVQKRNKSRSR